MTTMLERAARAMIAAEQDQWDLPAEQWDFTTLEVHGLVNLARAVLMAVREPDDVFMNAMYPDPMHSDRSMTKQGERSRRVGRAQIAHFIDAILSEEG